jgi:hypothetical protein
VQAIRGYLADEQYGLADEQHYGDTHNPDEDNPGLSAVTRAVHRARTLLQPWQNCYIAEFSLEQMRGLHLAAQIILPKNQTGEPLSDAEFGLRSRGSALATQETLSDLEGILLDLAPSQQDEQANESPCVAPAPSGHGQNGGTLSQQRASDPSLNQIVEIHQALGGFLSLRNLNKAATYSLENEYLPSVERLADALSPFRRQPNSIKGWSTRIKHAVCCIVDAFDKIIHKWGWDWVAKPKPERCAYIKQRTAVVYAILIVPLLEAARYLADRCCSDAFPWEDFADMAREIGLAPRDMPVDQASNQFKESQLRFWSEPRLGRSCPTIEDQEYQALDRAWQLLDVELIMHYPYLVESPFSKRLPEPASSPAPQHVVPSTSTQGPVPAPGAIPHDSAPERASTPGAAPGPPDFQAVYQSGPSTKQLIVAIRTLMERTTGSKAPDQPGSKAAVPASTKRLGRPPDPDYNPEEDQRIFEGWQTAKAEGCRSYADYKEAARLVLEPDEIKAAIDRHRKRLEKASE